MYRDSDIIVTSWKVLKRREDISAGKSCYFLKEGYKVSKFFDKEGNLKIWYCDIIETIYSQDSYIFNDLLLDVVIHKDGRVEVVDIAELVEAYEKQLITIEQFKSALNSLDKLLKIIYSGSFSELTAHIENIETAENK